MKTSLIIQPTLCLVSFLLAIQTINGDATNTQQNGGLTSTNTSICYTVQMKYGFLTYCNITTMWKPTVKKSHAIAAGFIIAFLALVFILYGFKKAGSTLRGLCCTCKQNTGCFTLSNFVFAAVLRILWKVIDVALDTMTYYRLGSGGLIDPGIYRNPHVVNSLLAFTCLGVVAMLLTVRLIYLKAEEIKEHGDVKAVKLMMVLIAFLLEDCVQMFLEYYWIQKYVTSNVPVYLVIKDFVISFIAFHALLCSVWVLKRESSTRFDYIFFTFGVAISLAQFLRVGAVVKQYMTGVLNHDCLRVVAGKLWQTPFDSGCMKKVDYWILVLTWFPFLSVPFLIVTFREDIAIVSRTIRGQFTSQPLIAKDGEI